MVKHCPAGHLYHRLADLRLQLEEAALGSSEQVDVTEDGSTNGRTRLTRLDDWLVAVDKFWSDAANEDEPSKASRPNDRGKRRTVF